MPARRGLSEVLGALILVIVMIGAVATIYMAGYRVSTQIREAGMEASEGIIIARSPPTVRLESRSGTVYAIITSPSPIVLDGLVVLTREGGRDYIPLGESIAPGEDLEIPLYSAPCRPTRLILIPQGAPPLLYPGNGAWYCESPTGEGAYSPETGSRLLSLPVEPGLAMGEKRYQADITINLRGGVSSNGISKMGPIRAWVNNSYAGLLRHYTKHPLNLTSIGPVTLQLRQYKALDMFALLITFHSQDGSYIVRASVDAVYHHVENPTRTVGCSAWNWTLPIIYTPIIGALSVSGVCKDPVNNNNGYADITASAEVLTSRNMVILLSTTRKTLWINYTLRMSLEIYEANSSGSCAETPLSPGTTIIALERPTVYFPQAAKATSRVNALLNMLADPLLIRIIVYDENGTILGSYPVDAASGNMSLYSDRSLAARICAEQALPATNINYLVFNNRRAYPITRLSVEKTVIGVAQPWAFPALLVLAGPSNSSEAIVYPRLGEPPVRVPVMSLFRGETIGREGVTLYLKAASRGAGWLSYRVWNPDNTRSVEGPVTGRFLLEYIGAPGPLLVYWRAGTLDTVLGGLDAYAGAVVWLN